MTKSRFYAAVLIGSLASCAVAWAAPPVPSTSAQGRAERACRAEGLQSNSPEWELCRSHATRAYEGGNTSLARQFARSAGVARDACTASGLVPGSLGYQACIDVEVDARTHLQILGDDKSGENFAQAR